MEGQTMEKAKVYFSDFRTVANGDGLTNKLKKLIRKAGIGASFVFRAASSDEICVVVKICCLRTTNALMIVILTCIARSLLSNPESMAKPCSVKA